VFLVHLPQVHLIQGLLYFQDVIVQLELLGMALDVYNIS